MKTTEWLTIISMLAGMFLAILASTITISFKLGHMDEKLTSIEKTVNRHTDAIALLTKDMGEMKVKVDVLWRHEERHTHSEPTGAALKAMQNSDVAQFVNQHYGEILSEVSSFEPENARQAEELLISIVNRYQEEDEYRDKFYEAALESGHDLDSLLYAAAWSIRDKVVHDLGF